LFEVNVNDGIGVPFNNNNFDRDERVDEAGPGAGGIE
jgi:hypothetical protein